MSTLKHATRATDKALSTLKKKLERDAPTPKNKLIKGLFAEIGNLKTKLKTSEDEQQKKFDFGFCLALVLLCRSYEPLHEHAFNIFEEAGYSITDFDNIALDPEDKITLQKIFSL